MSSKTFSTKGLARAWGLRTEREIEERVAKGDRAMPTITVGELVTGWASERIPLSQSYRLHSEFILPRMGSLVAAELTTKDVRSLLADYQARGVSNASVNRLKSCLSSILSRGVRLS